MRRKKDEKDPNMQWKEDIAALVPAPRQEQSPARARVHEAFDEITAARARGVTWQQLTDLMSGQGVLTSDGEPLTADVVRALYHSERYARGLRSKRRPARKDTPPLAQQVTPSRASSQQLSSSPSKVLSPQESHEAMLKEMSERSGRK